jgi:transcriptional regulator with XRE-family HTH domain
METAQSEPPGPGQAGPLGFGALLRRYRLAAGLSQEELAERAGLSVQGLSALENGRRARAEVERAASLCRQVGTSAISGYPHMALGFICFGEGYWPAATEHLQQAVTLAAARANPALVIAQSVLAEIDLLEGRPDQARAPVDAILKRFPPEYADLAYLLPKLAWAHLELGELAQASLGSR